MLKQHDNTKRLLKVRGVGLQTATAIIAAIGDGSQFDKSRDLAACLGLVPKLFSTGEKNQLGRITKHGDKYIRTLLVHGARAVVTSIGDKRPIEPVVRTIKERQGVNRTIVVLATKNARIIWSLHPQSN